MSCAGRMNKQIAADLNINLRTVKLTGPISLEN
jgi:FixJ family two-component response regulator